MLFHQSAGSDVIVTSVLLWPPKEAVPQKRHEMCPSSTKGGRKVNAESSFSGVGQASWFYVEADALPQMEE